MERRAKLIPINDAITLVNDANESTFYVVRGEKRALMIDTANGWENVVDIAREITPLPLTVVNTHGHCDHVYGNIYCKEALMHPDDFALHNEHFSFPDFIDQVKKLGGDPTPCPLMPLEPGFVFDLGGLMLETLSLKGHTQGSIGLLDREHRILFSGDGVIPHIWMQLDESAPIATLRQTLQDLLSQHGDEFDHVLTGHGNSLDSADIAKRLLEGCESLLAGSRSEDRPYPWFRGTGLEHPCAPDWSVSICYAESKL